MQPWWKTVKQSLNKLNIELPSDPIIVLLDIYPKENKYSNKYLYTNTHSSTIHIIFIKAINNANVHQLMNG